MSMRVEGRLGGAGRASGRASMGLAWAGTWEARKALLGPLRDSVKRGAGWEWLFRLDGLGR